MTESLLKAPPNDETNEERVRRVQAKLDEAASDLLVAPFRRIAGIRPVTTVAMYRDGRLAPLMGYQVVTDEGDAFTLTLPPELHRAFVLGADQVFSKIVGSGIFERESVDATKRALDLAFETMKSDLRDPDATTTRREAIEIVEARLRELIDATVRMMDEDEKIVSESMPKILEEAARDRMEVAKKSDA